MSALGLHVRVLRRARRWLPTALAPVGLLAPACGMHWEASPLSRLGLPGTWRRGVLGVRLETRAAAMLAAHGLAWLKAQRHDEDANSCYEDWRTLQAGQGLYLGRSANHALALLLDARKATAWLSWQDPPTRSPMPIPAPGPEPVKLPDSRSASVP